LDRDIGFPVQYVFDSMTFRRQVTGKARISIRGLLVFSEVFCALHYPQLSPHPFPSFAP